MDNTIFLTSIGIVFFLSILYLLFKNKQTLKVKTKEEKKYEIIKSYKQELHKALELLENNTDARVAKKNELLQKFNKELAMNIFFDPAEIKTILMELVKE
jgi:hypothetical protein